MRRDPRPPRDWSRLRVWILGGAAAVVAIVVIVVLTTVVGGGGGGDAQALVNAGCVQETFPSQGRQHQAELEEGFEYNSFPATSGPHHPQPALWGIYDRPVEQVRVVHNLEHGGVIVQYGEDVPPETVAMIERWYAETDRAGLIVAPLPDLGDRVALTAWTRLATCPGFDATAFDAFVAMHRFNGPERLPANAMQPGT